MINIAFIIGNIDNPYAGTEKQVMLLLEKIDRTRFNPVLCVINDFNSVCEKSEITNFYNLNIVSLFSFDALISLLKFVCFLKKNKIKIVHAFFKDGIRIGIIAAKIAGVELIVSARRSQGYWMSKYDLIVSKILNLFTDLIISNSINTKRWVIDLENFHSDKIKVIYNGVDIESFRLVAGDAREEFKKSNKIQPDCCVVGIVANLRKIKSIDVFLKAAALIKDSIHDVHFVVVGSGDQWEYLSDIAKELNLSDCTHFLGTRQDIPNILAGFDIGVLSSSSESFSNAIIEYMAAGLPVVCTDVGGVREAVENGVNGFVVPVADYHQMAASVLKILRSSHLRNSMSALNKRRAFEAFSVESMVDNHMDAYTAQLNALNETSTQRR